MEKQRKNCEKYQKTGKSRKLAKNVEKTRKPRQKYRKIFKNVKKT